MWHGKVLVPVTVLVPVLFVLLGQYAAPDAAGAGAARAAGPAGVGLTITGVVLVPVIAAGCMAPLALRAPRRAAIGVRGDRRLPGRGRRS